MSRSSSKGKNPFKHRNVLLNLERLEDRTTPSCNSISGYVYHDANNNGHFDDGETPIANSVIELRSVDGNKLIDTTTTNADGFYKFEDDPTQSTEELSVSQTLTFALSSKFHNEGTIEAFDTSLGKLTGVEIIHEGTISSEIEVENVSQDTASDIDGVVSGKITLTAPGVTNILNISGEAGPTFHATPYDDDLNYRGTSGQTFGNISVTQTNAPEHTWVTDEEDLALYTGDEPIEINQDAIATTHASSTGGGDINSQIRSKTSGKVTVIYHYEPHACLEPGEYKIIQKEQPDGYDDGQEEKDGDVIPNSNTTDIITVELEEEDLINNNFGELKGASISGHVYHDADNDGNFDDGEDAIAGATVKLTGPGGVVTTATTNEDGFYEFTNLTAGTYQLNETPQPTGYLDGKDTAGTKGGTVTNDQIAAITLGDGDHSEDNDFGELKPASIAGHVYFDKNNNGIRESGETAIAGVTVKLTGFDDLGPVEDEQVTNELGEYKFSNLRPGTYALTETQPTDYDDGKDKVGSQGGTLGADVFSNINLAAGVDGVDNDFGEIRPDRPGEPIPKTVNPLGGTLPIISKVQLTAIPEPEAIEPVLRGQMAFVVATNITLTGAQPSTAQTLATVKQIQNGTPPGAIIDQLWNSAAHRGLQADTIYQSVFNRAPTAAERAEAIQTLQAEGELALRVELFASEAYGNLHPTAESLVQGLYADIFNKIPGTQATQDMLQSMDNSPLEDVVHGLVNSNESLSNLIDDVYRQTLRRPASSAEIATWLTPIKGGSMTLDELGQRLLNSQEFYQLAFASIR